MTILSAAVPGWNQRPHAADAALHVARPPTHRRFIEQLEFGPSLRSAAEAAPGSLKAAYNDCMHELEKFRSQHKVRQLGPACMPCAACASLVTDASLVLPIGICIQLLFTSCASAALPACRLHNAVSAWRCNRAAPTL